jgi:hypothetical protein
MEKVKMEERASDAANGIRTKSFQPSAPNGFAWMPVEMARKTKATALNCILIASMTDKSWQYFKSD